MKTHKVSVYMVHQTYGNLLLYFRIQATDFIQLRQFQTWGVVLQMRIRLHGRVYVIIMFNRALIALEIKLIAVETRNV